MTRSSSLTEHPRSSYSHPLPAASSNNGLPLPSIVGMDRPTKKLLRWLSLDLKETEKELRVVSIVGPTGMGKTTLALELRKWISCQSSGGRHYFQFNAMAQASRRADRNELLLRDILSQISDPAPALASEPMQSMSLEVLVQRIRQRLEHKRYFILIDDMYMRRESDWEKIKGAFPDDNVGSRILIATRFPSIAWLCSSDSGGLVHVMKPLNRMDSERLLLLKAFGSVDVPLQENDRLYVDKTLMRCEGIPLFLSCMADCLKQQLQQQKQNQQHQEEAEQDEDHQRNGIYNEEQVSQLPEQIKQALASTFDDIPYDLRSLSLYMSMFPNGYKFDKDRPVMKWLCEDLTDDWDEWRNVEDADAAENYFFQLVDTNVITSLAASYKIKQDEGEASQWHVNHFMQKFLAFKSAESGFAFTSATLNLEAASATGHGNKTRIRRRLAVHHSESDPCLPSLFETIDLSQTRSLAVSGPISTIPFDKFNLVVLDLEGWENLKDDDLLRVCKSKMYFLQYLSVRNTQVEKLPDEIEELCSLMILDLRGTRIRQLPKQIVGLHSTLRALLLGSEGMMINPSALAAEQHLHMLSTLATIDLSEQPASFVEALGAMKNLRVLAITWSFHQSSDGTYREALRSSIRKWKRLKSLTIHCGLGCSMEFLGVLPYPPRHLEKFKVTAGRFVSIPKWITAELNFLSFVQITICRQYTNDMQILGKLPNLECLVLGLDFFPEYAIVIESEGFPELQRFSVDCLVPWLTFTKGAMRKLTYLQLKFLSCPVSSQTIVPLGIGSLQNLAEVALCYNKRFSESPNVKVIEKAVREAVADHDNQVDLFINSVQYYDIQSAEEVTVESSELKVESSMLKSKKMF